MKRLISNRTLAHLTPKNSDYDIWDTRLPGFLIRVYKSGRSSYVCQLRRGKRITLGSTDILSAADAREMAKNYLSDFTKGIDPTKKNDAAEHTLESFLTDEYGPWVTVNRKDGAATLKRLRSCFKTLLTSRLDEIDSFTVSKWQQSRSRKGIAKATINRDTTALKAVLSKAVEWQRITVNPLANLKPLKLDTAGKVRFLSNEEEKALRAALDQREAAAKEKRISANQWREKRGYDLLPAHGEFTDHLKPMILLSLNTGVRRGELFSLTWEDVNLDLKFITINGDAAKSNKTRHIPLNQEAAQALTVWKNQCDGSGLVFPGKDGNRLDNVKKAWTKLLEDAKVDNFRWHDMRHDFASKLVMAGVDLNTVRELLGHSDIKMTLRYAHLAPKHKADAVAKLDHRVSPPEQTDSPGSINDCLRQPAVLTSAEPAEMSHFSQGGLDARKQGGSLIQVTQLRLSRSA